MTDEQACKKINNQGNYKMRSLWVLVFLGGFLLMMQSCTVGPDYHRPDVAAPVAFKEAPQGWKLAAPANEKDRGAWWNIYSDPLLNELVPQVAINNQNLKAYEAAYREARAVVRGAQADLFPTVTADPGVTRARNSGGTQITQSAEMSAGWAPDLWGKVRRQIESNQAGAEASAAQLADLTLSAQAELVTDYFLLRYQDSLTRLLNDTVRAYERTLKITQNQYGAGVAVRSDVATAEMELESARASAIEAAKLRAQYEHAIALLVGRPPSDLIIPPGELSQSVPTIPLVVPSTLLERRPDIAEAERTMQQKNALIGVEMAAYYPSVTLSAAGGYSGTSPLFSVTNSVWSLAASASQTLFDGGARSASVDAARAAYESSVATYRNAVLTAFQDVEDQLSNLRILERQAAAEAIAVRAAEHSVAISINEYQAGTVTYTTVITAQVTALSNKKIALQIQEERLVASANLIKALGGGWSVVQLSRQISR